MTILDEIIAHKKGEISENKAVSSVMQLRSRAGHLAPPKGFSNALLDSPQSSFQPPAIIAEIKRASPSKGIIRADLDPVETAQAYASAGARCLSVLTDEKYFGGSADFIPQIQSSLGTATPPILRKDFIIDPYQVWETRALGADAMLLIVSALSEESLLTLLNEGRKAKLDILVEIHNLQELEQAIDAIAKAKGNGRSQILLGINNRDLKTFETNLEVTKQLASLAKEKMKKFDLQILLVSESGIKTADDLGLLHFYGADAFLIGETLVAEGEPGENLAALIRGFSSAR